MQTNPKGLVRICHFSDLHLPLRTRVPLPKLLGKRLLGYANLRFIRGNTHKLDAFLSLLEQLASEQADYVIITGDLANLSLGVEFLEIDAMFRQAGLVPETTLLVPGNHDRYSLGADASSAFELGMASWLPDGFSRDQGYPFVKMCGPIAIIALDTAVWRNAIRAAGYISPSQVARLVDILNSDSMQKCWPVIAMHHPLFHRSTARLRDYLAGLDGVDRLTDAIEGKAATVLHGHLHQLSRRQIGSLDVIGVSSASNDIGEKEAQLAYHVYTFDQNGLKEAEGVRHWPGADDKKKRFERFTLPKEALVD